MGEPVFEETQLLLPFRLGGQMVDALRDPQSSFDDVKALPATDDAARAFDALQYVMQEPCFSGFLHSALCAMSLPVRRPKDEFAPIVRRDGKYTLIVAPGERSRILEGKVVQTRIGVPFGVLARLVMLFIITEAVKKQSRTIELGSSFSAWMRRMGIFNTNSGGSRGTRSLVQDQVERLMSCAWTIRWDDDDDFADEGRARKRVVRGGQGARQRKQSSINAFAVSEMKMVNSYGGMSGKDGEFVSCFVLSEEFYSNLVRHAVPLNERAFAALKASATQLDLYTYLVYRLPKIREDEEVRLPWSELAKHMGNETDQLFKFRQTVRKAWVTVSGVYQQARHSVFLDDQIVRLRKADPPLDGHLHKLPSGEVRSVTAPYKKLLDGAALLSSAKHAGVSVGDLRFPRDCDLRYTPGCEPLCRIAKEHGSGWDIDKIARDFRNLVGDEVFEITSEQLVRRFTAYCKALTPP